MTSLRFTEAATSENSFECGTVVTVNMPGDVPSFEDHSNAILQYLHQRKKSKITTNLTDVQEDTVPISIRVSSSETDSADYSHVRHMTS